MNAERKIIEAYHRTTSSRSGTVDEHRYQLCADGLKRRLRGWLPEPQHNVLDLGCGMGELLYLFHSLGCRNLTGVNLCQEEIDQARRFVLADFYRADLLQFLRESHDTYDWIGCFNIFEHLEKDQILEALQLCASRLRSGGCLVVMVPNGLSPYSGVTRYWDFTHKLAFVPNNFRQLMPICGFDTVEFRECGPVPHGIISTIRYGLWMLVRQCIKARLMIEVADVKEGIYTMDMLLKMVK